MGLVRMILTLLPALPHFKPTEPFLPSLSRSSSFLHHTDSQSSDSRNNKATFAPSSERNRVLFHCSSQHIISDRRESKYLPRGFFSLALSPILTNISFTKQSFIPSTPSSFSMPTRESLYLESKVRTIFFFLIVKVEAPGKRIDNRLSAPAPRI